MSEEPIRADKLAREALAAGSPTAWFDALYSAAARDEAVVPWDRGEPHPLLVRALGDTHGTGRSAIVVGCGLGEDAEFVAARGFATTAFDVSAAAIEGAKARFPDSRVTYTVADLLRLPRRWHGAFDLVVESLTVQALPRGLRPRAIVAVRSLVAASGALLVISGALDDGTDPHEGPPWPLTRAELDEFAADGLQPRSVERVPGTDGAGATRWLALFASTGTA